jgi:hypothetical protein
MLDFLNLVELFERHGVTFVSVTQSFNTKDAMGRMALNILVTFAQFERELKIPSEIITIDYCEIEIAHLANRTPVSDTSAPSLTVALISVHEN